MGLLPLPCLHGAHDSGRDAPCVILAAGARVEPSEARPDGEFVVSEVAIRHGAGVERETTSSDDAYAPFGPMEHGPYREGTLPD